MPQTDGTSHGADESQCRDYGRIKGKGTDEMGWTDEQCTFNGRGNCVERTGILLMNLCQINWQICDEKCAEKSVCCLEEWQIAEEILLRKWRYC